MFSFPNQFPWEQSRQECPPLPTVCPHLTLSTPPSNPLGLSVLLQLLHLFQIPFDAYCNCCVLYKWESGAEKKPHPTSTPNPYLCTNQQLSCPDSRHLLKDQQLTAVAGAQIIFATLYLALQESLSNLISSVGCSKPLPDPEILYLTSSCLP